MRLYLSSYRVGDSAGSLLTLLLGGAATPSASVRRAGGETPRAAIIENALDCISPGVRQIYREEVYDPASELAALGIASSYLDLRHYFAAPDRLASALAGFDLVWVIGGNAFVLRRAMKQSGFDDVITGMLERDEIVYGGFSAGAVVAAPSLVGIHLMDDPDEIPTGYATGTVWDGLGLIDHAIVPHFRSPHPESAAAERAARHLCAKALRYRALRDGEAIVWTENRQRPTEPLRRIA